MKQYLLFFSLLASSLSGVSCQSERQPQKSTATASVEEKSYTGARLVQIDSIMVDVIGNFKVYDYQPESGLFLGGDIGSFFGRNRHTVKSNELGHIIFNRTGRILHQFNNTNRGPEGHGSGAYNSTFLGPESIGVMGRKALYQYGLKGTLNAKYSAVNITEMAAYSFEKVMYSADARHIAVGLPKFDGASPKAPDFFQRLKPLRFYDLNDLGNNQQIDSAGITALHGFPDDPVYGPESEIHKYPLPPHMALDYAEKELYTVYPALPVALVYDIMSGKLKRSLDLAPDYFEVATAAGSLSSDVKVKGLEAAAGTMAWLNRGGTMANAQYHEVIQLGSYTLFRYSPALPANVLSQLINGSENFGTQEQWPRIRKKYYRFYYQLFKDGKKMLPDFELPLLEPKPGQGEMRNNLLTRGKIIGGNGLGEIFIFFPNDGEVERDYELIRVYKLELIEE